MTKGPWELVETVQQLTAEYEREYTHTGGLASTELNDLWRRLMIARMELARDADARRGYRWKTALNTTS